jgi:hypothetical protein
LRIAAARKREETLFPDPIARSMAPMKHFLEVKDSPAAATLLRTIGASEEVQARGWPGTMPIVIKLLRSNLCSDENLALLFGDPELTRSVVLEAEEIVKARN